MSDIASMQLLLETPSISRASFCPLEAADTCIYQQETWKKARLRMQPSPKIRT